MKTFIIYADVMALLEKILARQREILGKRLVGLYVYGSVVAGDFDYEISDVDLLAATEILIDGNEFAALERMHHELVSENPLWRDRIEIQYVSLYALKTFKTETSTIANISPGEAFHFLEAGRDWLLNWYFVRENSITLFGAETKTIIEPISKQEFIENSREQASERAENIEMARHSRPFQAYLILTICRALYAVEIGEQVSKRRAALWAKEKFSEYANLIERAFEWRKNSRQQNVDHETTFDETREFIHFIVAQIAKSEN
ncbi:MAG TPA: aminoglycoside adenylyltransferase domain-containing protein [Pyrinomonadaceae bacterium]